MGTSMHENHCVIKGSLEEMAYKALFKQLLDPAPVIPDKLTDQNGLLTDKINELKAQSDAATDEQKIQELKDMEALQAAYLKYEAQLKSSQRQTKYIPIFAGEDIQDIEVIIPNCAHLKAAIENNPFTNRSSETPDTGSSITTAGGLTRMGLEMPANAIYKVNYDSCTMTFDSSNKITISPNVEGESVALDKIRLFQKHVLASVMEDPQAPIKISFPKSIDDKRKFEIINEMIVAYMSVTGPKGEIDSKGSEARREQFIKNLLAGNTITYSDTISVAKNDSPKIFTGKIKDWGLETALKNLKGTNVVNQPSTKEMVSEYQESIKQLNRQGIMMEMMNAHLNKGTLEALVKDMPGARLLTTREVVRSGTNAPVGGAQMILRGLEGLIPASFKHNSGARNDMDDKYELYSREGIDNAHKRVIKACMADIILKVAGIDSKIEAGDIVQLDSFKKLNDPKTYNMQTGEVLAFLNSDTVEKARKEIRNPSPSAAPGLTT
jgi:hypothetical protein